MIGESYSKRVDWNEQVDYSDPFDALRNASQGWEPGTTLVLIDSRHAAYRAWHTRQLSTEDGTDTSALHGVLHIAAATCECAREACPVFVWDGNVKYKRSIYPEYKIRHDRQRTPEEEADHIKAQRSLKTAQVALSMFDVPTLCIPDIEADDAIGLAVGEIEKRFTSGNCAYKRVVIVSDDKDYYQLAQDKPMPVYVWRGNLQQLRTASDLKRQYGFSMLYFPLYKALVGEPATGDNIPGVPGVGDKTAAALVTAHASIQSLLDHCARACRTGKPKKVERNIHSCGEPHINRALVLSRIVRRYGDLSVYKQHVDSKRAQRLVCEALDRASLSERHVSRKQLRKFAQTYEFRATDPIQLACSLGLTVTD